MPLTCAFVSFRLGLSDGVSVVAATWQRCFDRWGWNTYRVAGEGPVERTVAGLSIGAEHGPDQAALEDALVEADLVVIENLLTIPMNLPASRALAEVMRGRPTILHHHDPPWQRERFAHIDELPPDDPAWHHVTINHYTEAQFAARGLTATTIYNGFDVDVVPGDRQLVRDRLGIGPDETLVAHPVRAIARKNIPGALAVTTALGGVYWLPGQAEEDYAPELARVLSTASCPVLRTPIEALAPNLTIDDLYGGCDLVAFPSTWEGFGNPPIEAALHNRPVVVGRYPISDELRQLGFWWLDAADPDTIREAIADPPVERLRRNRRLVEQHLSLEIMASRVKDLLAKAGF